MKVAVIADTHGLLRPEVVERLRGSGRIIHAGDVGKPELLERLNQLVPTLAVRGNVDRGPWAEMLSSSATVTWQGVTIHVLHDVKTLAATPPPPGVRIVVSGHSHRQNIQERDGVIFLNPGSVGPRRFRLPVAMAFLHLAGGGQARVEAVELLP